MALISGRPISFQMNLYDALFIKRPVVEPELFASLRPPTYSGALGRLNDDATDQAAQLQKNRGKRGESKAGKPYDRKKLAGAVEKQDQAIRDLRTAQKDLDGEAMDLGGSVKSVASAEKLGDYFQYAIDHPVTLPRQKSALLPIVGKKVAGDRVSIYSERVHPKFPLLGLVFTNETGMNLTQGPVTVYEGSTYAGDARIPDLQKGERRLLSYAVDLGTEVQAVPHSDNGKYRSIKFVKGVLHTTTKLSESKTYNVANRGDAERVVIIEHPNRTDFKLTTKEKPWETAADVHRFLVKVPAGKTVPFTVSEEKVFESRIAVTNLDDQQIRVFLEAPVTSDKVKDALRRVMELRGKVADVQREIQQQERQLKVITEDQVRLRANLREMPPTAEAYKRYLKKFDDQETQIENFQKKIKELQDEEHSRRKEFESFLANLNVE
jgi:hypothetical protein